MSTKHARPLSAIVDSTRQFLETTPAPVAGDDQVVEAPPVAGDDQVVEAPPVAGDDQVVEAPPVAGQALRLAPRPFSQLARRHYRLFGGVCYGYNAFLSAWPYYHQRRRGPAVWCDPFRLGRAHQRRTERARARRALLTVTRLPPMLYGQGKVA